MRAPAVEVAYAFLASPAPPVVSRYESRDTEELEQSLNAESVSIDTLLERASTGHAFWRVYRQFKMYNDPALNPAIYGESKRSS